MTIVRRHISRRTAVAAAALAATAAAGLLLGVATPALAGDVSPTPATSPVGDWRTSTHGVRQTITFTRDGQVHGDAGCNRFSGTYTTHGSHITIGPLASTLMMCDQSIMDAEQTYLVKLQAAVSYSATATTLKIFAPKDMVPFVRR